MYAVKVFVVEHANDSRVERFVRLWSKGGGHYRATENTPALTSKAPIISFFQQNETGVLMRRLFEVSLAVMLVVTGAHAERLVVAGSTGVAIIDTVSGKTISSAPVAGGATQLLATRDGSRLVAISRGPGATSWLGNFKPKGKATVSVIDGTTMKVLRQQELGWDASDAQISADEKTVVILSPGAMGRFASAWAIDLATGEVAGKADFYRSAHGLLLTASNHAVVYFEGAPKKAPTRLTFMEVPALKVTNELEIEGRTLPPAAFENQDLIYLLEASGNKPATLNVISASQQKIVATPEVGQLAAIGAFDPATSRLFVLSHSTERGKRGYNGRIDIFRNGELEKSMKTVDGPEAMTFTPDRRKAFVHDTTHSTLLNLETFEQTEKPFWLATPHSTYFTPDQKRALFYFAAENTGCCAASVFDMENETMMKHFGVGGRGARIAEALLAATVTAASFASAQAEAKRSGASSFHYSVYTPRTTTTVGAGPLTVHPDGKFAYAVDAKTSRVTTIDLTIGDRQKADINIKGGARELVAMKKGAVLAVMGEKSLTFVDSAARSVIAEHAFPGELRRVELTGDGSRAIAVADGRIAVFDDQGRVLAENTSVAAPNDWILMK